MNKKLKWILMLGAAGLVGYSSTAWVAPRVVRVISYSPQETTRSPQTPFFSREHFNLDLVTDAELDHLNEVMARLESMAQSKVPLGDKDIVWLTSHVVDVDENVSWNQREYMLMWSGEIGQKIYEVDANGSPLLTDDQFEQIKQAVLWVLIADRSLHARTIAAVVAMDLGVQEEQGFFEGIEAVRQNPWNLSMGEGN